MRIRMSTSTILTDLRLGDGQAAVFHTLRADERIRDLMNLPRFSTQDDHFPIGTRLLVSR